MVRNFVLRAVERVAPRGLRGRRVAATLASLRQVSLQVDQRLGTETEDAGAQRRGSPVRPIPVDKTKASRREERKQVAKALFIIIGHAFFHHMVIILI